MTKQSALQLAFEYDWSTEQEYFDYVIESHVNGQYSQVKNLYEAMNDRSQKDFILFLVWESDYRDAEGLHRYLSE